MSLAKVLIVGARAWRSVAGKDTTLEQAVKQRYIRAITTKTQRSTGRNFIQYSGRDFVIVSSKRDPEPRMGVLLRGGCDLPSVFAAAPLLQRRIKGTVAIYKQGSGSGPGAEQAKGGLGANRSDQILQTLRDYPENETRHVRGRLKLGSNYLNPRLLTEKTFAIDGYPQFGEFPKNVVVLSTGSDLVRTMYRHRQHGYLVDPGGFWQNQLLDKVLPDPSVATWFKENFESIGRISVEEFTGNYERIIRILKEEVGAHVIVYNSLLLDPGNPTHNYQLLKRAPAIRRREFHLALIELSARLDFHILDVDRVLKRQGVREQVDFAHFSTEGLLPIAAEAYRILKDLEVL
jgi:hypothetical protein